MMWLFLGLLGLVFIWAAFAFFMYRAYQRALDEITEVKDEVTGDYPWPQELTQERWSRRQPGG